MDIKKDTGLAGMDMIIAIVAIIIFTTLILALMCNNAIENVKIAKETMAMIYITEIFENVGIQAYDDNVYNNIGLDYTEITEENILVPQEVIDNYKVEMKVEDTFDDIENKEQDILKKVYLTLTYEIGDKTYSCSMERLKVKE